MTALNGEIYWEKGHIGCLFIYFGESTRPALGRQGRGVALILGPHLQRAWRASGSRVASSGPCHYSGESTRPALGRQGRGVALILGPQLHSMT